LRFVRTVGLEEHGRSVCHDVDVGLEGHSHARSIDHDVDVGPTGHHNISRTDVQAVNQGSDNEHLPRGDVGKRRRFPFAVGRHQL
jgi:hypothetical protein